MRLLVLTVAAMLAFAANSVLARLALRSGLTDAATFAVVRLGTGALMLAALVQLRGTGRIAGSWRGAFLLALYAVPFAFAYLELSTGTGALLLFGAVQVTMLVAGIVAGERPGLREWTGFSVAVAGLLVLLLPGVTAPVPWAAAAMLLAGYGWGRYSLRGRGKSDPLAETAGNFMRALPLALPALLLTGQGPSATTEGLLLATVSGAIASGLGYAVWYTALPGLAATRAAMVQLSVPAIAALAGVLLLAEPLTPRLVLAGAAILGGVGMAVAGRHDGRTAR